MELSADSSPTAARWRLDHRVRTVGSRAFDCRARAPSPRRPGGGMTWSGGAVRHRPRADDFVTRPSAQVVERHEHVLNGDGGPPQVVFGGPAVARVLTAPVAIPVAAEYRPQVSAGDGQLLSELISQFLLGRLDNREAVEAGSPQRLDDIGVQTVACCPEPHQPAGLVVPDRPCERPGAPTDRALAETELVADPLTGRVDRKPRQLVGVYVEHEYDCADFQGVGVAEELPSHPQLVEGPADVGRAEPKPLGGDVSHLDEMP